MSSLNDLPNLSIDLPTIIRTLTLGGFLLDTAQRNPGFILIFTHRYDEFGLSHSYCFVFSEDCLDETQYQMARISAKHKNAHLIVVGSTFSDCICFDWKRFSNLFGGPILSSAPFEPEFTLQLIELGFNRLPDGLIGHPDDLFEEYVRVALEFILSGRVIRYGQERRFEARPDGIALPDLKFSALYDAKAYSKGYEVTLVSIRQFKDYVNEFQQIYQGYLPRLNSFIAISGDFPHKDETLQQRSRDLLAECGVPLSFLKAETLSQIILLLLEHPSIRRSINWSRIFSEPIVKSEFVEAEIVKIRKDKIIPAKQE